MPLHQEIRDQLGEIVKVCLSLTITIVSYPILVFISIIFLSYRCIIDIILKAKIGAKYGGLVATPDAIFFRDEKSKTYITSVLILKSKKKRNILKEFKPKLQKKLIGNPDYPKFTGTVNKFGGYFYLIKDTCNLDECVKELEVPDNVTFDEDYLKELMAAYVNKPFPQNDTVLWEFLFSKKPLKRTGVNDGCYHYVFVARFQHPVGDGTSLMAFLFRVLSDEEGENYSDKLFDNCFKKSYKRMSLFENLCLYLEQIKEATKDIFITYFTGIGRLVLNELKIKDDNALHGPALTGEKIVAWAAEDSMNFFPLVKKIKTRLDTKFTPVIMTAISASLTNFYKRNYLPVPESLRVVFGQLLEYPKLDKSKPVPLQNKTAGVYIDIVTPSSNLLIETLRRVSKAYQSVKMADFKVYKFFVDHSAIVPMHLVNKVFNFKNPTYLITNIPGGAQVNLLDGCVLEKLIPIVPNVGYLGVTFGILTYDNRFQLGLLVDKALIQSQKEAQRIVDDVFYYIKLLDEETKALEKNDLE